MSTQEVTGGVILYTTSGDTEWAKQCSSYELLKVHVLPVSVKGKAVTVLPAADSRTHTTVVRVDLPGEVKGAYPGMFARVHFATGRTSKLLIPARALVYRSEVAGAYVVGDKGEIRFRQLRLGEPSGAEGIEILAGVARGERVALDPVAALAQLKRGAH